MVTQWIVAWRSKNGRRKIIERALPKDEGCGFVAPTQANGEMLFNANTSRALPIRPVDEGTWEGEA